MTDLNRKIALSLGIEPKVRYIASRDGGESLAMSFDYKDECDEWCAAHPPYQTVRKEDYRAFDTDPECTVMLMKLPGFVTLDRVDDSVPYFATFCGNDTHNEDCGNFHHAEDSDPQKALAMAYAKAKGLTGGLEG